MASKSDKKTSGSIKAGVKTVKKATGVKIALLGGLVAAAAGAVYYAYNNKTLNKSAKQQVKNVKAWAEKAKKEVVLNLKKMKEIDQNVYHNVVDAMVKKYSNIKNIDTKELLATAKELKGHWGKIKKEVMDASKKTATAASKVSKKVVKAVKK